MAPHIHSLPNEVMLEIFSYLPTSSLVLGASAVCMRWNTLVNDPLLWREQVFVCDDGISSEDAVRILSQTPLLANFRMISEKLDVYIVLNALFRYCRNVRALHLQLFSINAGDYVPRAVRNLRKLEEIHVLSACTIEPFEFSDDFGKLMPLRSLIIPRAWHLDSFDLKTMADMCVNIAELDISLCVYLHEKDLIYLFEKRRDTLVFLKIGSEKRFTNALYQKLCMCRKLETLAIRNCRGMKNENLWNIGTLHLKSLSLTTVSVKPRSLCKFFNEGGGSRLTELVLTNSCSVDDQVAESISMNCTLLRIFSLTECYEITDCGVIYILGGCKCLTDLKLIYVTLTGKFLSFVPKLENSLKSLVLEKRFQILPCIKSETFQNIKMQWI